MPVVISFKGTGIAAIDASLSGFGQGLQVGKTRIDFQKGTVQLTDSLGRTIIMGSFAGLTSLGSKDSNARSFIFRSKTVCNVIIGKATYEYKNLNEWITFNYLSEQSIEIDRSATGQNPDVFDWQFFASDDPQFQFTIQKASRDSESEIIFASISRGIQTYTQITNLRGAKKIILTGNSPASAETGLATVTMEYFDSASGGWIPYLSEKDIFTLIQSQTKIAILGEDAPRKTDGTFKDYQFIYEATGGGFAFYDGGDVPPSAGGALSAFNANRNQCLPSGDNILRIKVVVSASALTFSIGVIKVFD